jgi:hypothetical protein
MGLILHAPFEPFFNIPTTLFSLFNRVVTWRRIANLALQHFEGLQFALGLD